MADLNGNPNWLRGQLAAWAAPVIVAVLGAMIWQSWGEVRQAMKEISAAVGEIKTDVAVIKVRVRTVERAIGVPRDAERP